MVQPVRMLAVVGGMFWNPLTKTWSGVKGLGGEDSVRKVSSKRTDLDI
jgi:hypothetical protein